LELFGKDEGPRSVTEGRQGKVRVAIGRGVARMASWLSRQPSPASRRGWGRQPTALAVRLDAPERRAILCASPTTETVAQRRSLTAATWSQVRTCAWL